MVAKKAQKKTAKKSVAKNYSGDEVKRYLDTLSEDFQHKVSAIGEQFGGLNKKLDEQGRKLDEHSRILNEHSRILNEHSRILNEHSRILNDHGRKLDEHGRVLNSHTQMIGQLMTDVQEIKNDLKQKVDRSEFARLEKRVLAIESREYTRKSRR